MYRFYKKMSTTSEVLNSKKTAIKNLKSESVLWKPSYTVLKSHSIKVHARRIHISAFFCIVIN